MYSNIGISAILSKILVHKCICATGSRKWIGGDVHVTSGSSTELPFFDLNTSFFKLRIIRILTLHWCKKVNVLSKLKRGVHEK